MKTATIVLQVVSAIILIVTVLLQQKDSGLSAVFGGGSSFYQTRRGAEKFVFYITIISALVFFLATVWQIFSR